MKFVRKQVMNVIKEEIASVLGEQEGSLQKSIDYLEEFIDVAKGKKAAADGGRSIAPSIAADFAKPLGDPTLGGDETFEGESTFDQFFASDNMPVDISDTLFNFLNRKIDQEKNNAKRKALRRMNAMFLNGSTYDYEIGLYDVQMPFVLKHAEALVNLLKSQLSENHHPPGRLFSPGRLPSSYHYQPPKSARQKKLEANDFDADDIEQLRSKVRSQSPSDALSFLFMGTDYGHVLSGGHSDLEPIDEELAYLHKLITKMVGRENSNKVKAEVEKLLHEIFPTIVERMSSGFQLKQLSSGDLYLTYVFNDPKKIKRVRDRVTEKAIEKAMERLGIDRSLLDRAKSFLGLDETKMKFTQEQVLNIIKEEIAAVLSEDMDLEDEIKQALSVVELDFEELFDEIYGDDSPGKPAPSPTAVPRLKEELEEALEEMLENEEIEFDGNEYKLA